MSNKNRYILIVFVVFFACGKSSSQGNYRADLFTEGESFGKVDKPLLEASGLVASVLNKDHYWTHNDSGNPAEIFLIDEHANIKLICKLKKVHNRDCEDIAIGPGPIEGKAYIYVGDIGDNKAEYPVKLIYRFEEPVLGDQGEIKITNIETLIVKLSDGIRDAEALTIDPISKAMFLFSKREDSVRLYQIKYPYQQDTLLAERMAILPFHKINAADISVDGKEVLIKDYDKIYYWKRETTTSIPELLKQPPIELPYKRGPQDEAIAWTRSGSGFFTLGETVKGKKGTLVFHKRK